MIEEVKVKEVLNKLRPQLQMDGGDMEFVALEGNVVKVRLQGACGCCPGATMTLKFGVERRLKSEVSEEIVVEAV